MTIAVSSVDVLFHLRKDEIFKSASVISPKETSGLQDGELDSMGRLCEHLLNQRRFVTFIALSCQSYVATQYLSDLSNFSGCLS